MQSSLDPSSRDDFLEMCRKLARQLLSGIVTFSEFADNVTLAMVAVEDRNLPRAVESIPSSVLADYARYLQNFLEPVDYMPCPLPFISGKVTEAEVVQKRRQLREKYIRLHDLVLKEAGMIGAIGDRGPTGPVVGGA